MQVLLTGWFSIDSDGNTGGDLLAMDTVAQWLRERTVPFTVAVSDTARYSGVVRHPMLASEDAGPDMVDGVVWVCGPLPDGPALEVLDRFAGTPTLALGVSVTDPGLENRFDEVLARDRPGSTALPDLSFGTRTDQVPVIGLIYVGPQPEYHAQREPVARDVVGQVLGERDAAVVDIDTRMPLAENPLHTPAQLESAISRMDVVITTRLHGALLALRNRVPVLALDSVSGGAKLSGQMAALGWPLTAVVDELDAGRLHGLLGRALSEDFTAEYDRINGTTQESLVPYRDALTHWLEERVGQC